MYSKNRFLALLILSLAASVQAANLPDRTYRSNRDSDSRFSNPWERLEKAIFRYVLENRKKDGYADMRNDPWNLGRKNLLDIYDKVEAQLCGEVERMVATHGIDPRPNLIAETKNDQGNNPLHIVAQYGSLEQALAAVRIIYSTDFLHHDNNAGESPIEFARNLGKIDIKKAFQNAPLDDDADSYFGSSDCDSDCDCGNETCEQ